MFTFQPGMRRGFSLRFGEFHPDTNGLSVRQLGFQFHPLIEREIERERERERPPSLPLAPQTSLILQSTDSISFAVGLDLKGIAVHSWSTVCLHPSSIWN